MPPALQAWCFSRFLLSTSLSYLSHILCTIICTIVPTLFLHPSRIVVISDGCNREQDKHAHCMFVLIPSFTLNSTRSIRSIATTLSLSPSGMYNSFYTYGLCIGTPDGVVILSCNPNSGYAIRTSRPWQDPFVLHIAQRDQKKNNSAPPNHEQRRSDTFITPTAGRQPAMRWQYVHASQSGARIQAAVPPTAFLQHPSRIRGALHSIQCAQSHSWPRRLEQWRLQLTLRSAPPTSLFLAQAWLGQGEHGRRKGGRGFRRCHPPYAWRASYIDGSSMFWTVLSRTQRCSS